MSLQSLPSVLEELILEYSSFNTTQFTKVLQQINQLPRVGDVYELKVRNEGDDIIARIWIEKVTVRRTYYSYISNHCFWMGYRPRSYLEKYFHRIGWSSSPFDAALGHIHSVLDTHL